MEYVIASQILLWAAIIVLAGVCIALARQVGLLHERIAPAGALAINKRVAPGQPAPQLELQSLFGSTVSIGRPPAGRSQLLFFLSPTCPVCKTLLPVLRSAAAAESRWLDVIIASDGDETAQLPFAHANRLTRFAYVVSELLGRSFGVAKLPYAVLIDEAGRIAALGIINSREHLESLFEAKERAVGSVQQYLAGS